MPNSLAISGGAFSGATRGRAIGIWAAMGAVTGAAGPILGGWLIDTVGWRAIFLLNLLLAVAAIGLALGFEREILLQTRRRRSTCFEPSWRPPRAFGVMTWGLTVGSGSDGWTTSAVIAIGGGAVLLLFLGVEDGRTRP